MSDLRFRIQNKVLADILRQCDVDLRIINNDTIVTTSRSGGELALQDVEDSIGPLYKNCDFVEWFSKILLNLHFFADNSGLRSDKGTQDALKIIRESKNQIDASMESLEVCYYDNAGNNSQPSETTTKLINGNYDVTTVFFDGDDEKEIFYYPTTSHTSSASPADNHNTKTNSRKSHSEKTMAASYKILSDIISVSTEDASTILVNNEWTFTLPTGFEYLLNSKFDRGIQGGIDLAGSVKPLVVKGLQSGMGYLFNFALEKHFDLFGNFGTIVDCKYDNRMTDANSGAKQKIIIDSDNLFVDVIAVNTWPFGIDLQIRIRGEEITPFNFSAMAKGLDETDYQRITNAMKSIAESVCLVKSTQTVIKKKPVTKKTMQRPLDPNCIIEGTTLKKYIGSDIDVILPVGLTEIADNTFSERNIRSVVVPEGVKVIGRRAFENCFELEEAYLPSTLKELGGYAFVDCHKLRQITLGNKLTAIEDSLFSECFELNNVVIPKSVKHIDAFAFKNCRQFTSIVIPEGVESIGLTSFVCCSNLEYLYIPSSVTEIYDNIIMGNTPFDGCDKLTIHCPSGSAAEEYCKSHRINYVIDSNPKKVTAPISTLAVAKLAVESIPTEFQPQSRKTAKINRNFYSEEAIEEKKVKKEEKLKKASEKSDETNLIKESVPKKAVVYEGPAKFTITNGVLKKYEGTEETIVVPDKVTEIGKNAFKGNPFIKKVVLPEGLLLINDSAFSGCTALCDINLVNTIEDIGANAFNGCSSLETVIIPGNTLSIWKNTFANCSNLKTVVVHPNVNFIPKWWDDSPFLNSTANVTFFVEKNSYIDKEYLSNLFKGKENAVAYSCPFGDFPQCTLPDEKRILKVELKIWDNILWKYTGSDSFFIVPEGVKTIEHLAFSNGCYGESHMNHTLKKIVLPNTVSTLKWEAFAGCVALESIEIPYGVKVLNKSLFKGCSRLKNITIPDTVTKIDYYVFSDCKSLQSINMPKSLKTIHKDTLGYYATKEDFPSLIIYGEKGSIAEQFANSFNIRFLTGLPDNIPVPRNADTVDPTRAALAEKEKKDKQQLEEITLQKKKEEERRQAEEKRRQEENERKLIKEKRVNDIKAKIQQLSGEKKQQETIVDSLKGLKGMFGDNAKIKKAAIAKIEELNIEIANLQSQIEELEG